MGLRAVHPRPDGPVVSSTGGISATERLTFADVRHAAGRFGLRRLARRSALYLGDMATAVPRMRLILASTALAVTVIDPTEPATRVAATYTALALYVLYSAALRYLPIRGLSRIRHAYWFDVAWVTLLVTLSGGANSIFFFLYLFAILTASFDQGYKHGMAVALVSVAAFVAISATPITSPGLQVNWFLLRSIYLLVLGHMIATWGQSEISLRQRLLLLKDTGVVTNPRFGADHVIGTLLDGLRTLYGGARCVLVVADGEAEEYVMREAAENDTAARPVAINGELAHVLLQLPPTAVVLRAHGQVWPFAVTQSFDLETGAPIDVDPALLSKLMALFEAQSIVTVPLRYDAASIGRLYVASRTRRMFTLTDADFLLQAMDQLTLGLHNIRLVDTLASAAADHERQRIARDIHDTVLQPYVGLHLGLTALRTSLTSGQADAIERVERLLALTNSEMSGVRAYATDLKVDTSGAPTLESAIRRFAATLTSTAGIVVDVCVTGRLSLPDRVAAEIFQIVVEGLNNIRRHTDATSARVAIERSRGHIVISIANPTEAPDGMTFEPRTISERTVSLGGMVAISTLQETTTVTVEIPA